MVIIYGLFLLILLMVCPIGLVLIVIMSLLGSIMEGIKGR